MTLLKRTSLYFVLPFLTVYFLIFISGAVYALLAFPEAEGFGASASGGRGGDVYLVTNLNDSGPGSLREGIYSAQQPRTIIFNISGNIKLNSIIEIKKSNLTIAGQTAPGDGITLQNYPLIVNADNLIIRHIRVRLGTENYQLEDSISIIGGSNIIIDHCSASWSVDETLSITDRANNVTVQWTYITESLDNSIHFKGKHGYGSLIRPEINANYSFYYDLYADHIGRNPRVGSYKNSTTLLDFQNNLIYNWGGMIIYEREGDEFARINYVNNYLLAGPNTKTASMGFNESLNNIKVYESGNKITKYSIFKGNHATVQIPFTTPKRASVSADLTFEKILSSAGALPWNRDSADTRVTYSVLNNTGKIIDSIEQVGGWPTLNSTLSAQDTDSDGIPDYWETTIRTNSNYADNNKDINNNKYTNLEDYLNWLAEAHILTNQTIPVKVDLEKLNGNRKDLAFSIIKMENGKGEIINKSLTYNPNKYFYGLTYIEINVTNTKNRISLPMKVGILVQRGEKTTFISSIKQLFISIFNK